MEAARQRVLQVVGSTVEVHHEIADALELPPAMPAGGAGMGGGMGF